MSATMPEEASVSTFARLLRAALVVYWLAMFAASHTPRTPDLLPVEGGDKIVHFSAYGLLALLCALDRQLRGLMSRTSLLRIAGLLAIYGVVDELLQYPIDGRTCDAFDWIADVAGITVGLGLFALQRRLRGRSTTPG